MKGSVGSPFERLRGHRTLIAVTSALAVTALIYGLAFPLLSLVLERQGVSSLLIGLSSAVQSLAILLFAPGVPALIQRLGSPRLMAITIVVSVATLLLMRTWPDVYVWFPLRFVLGAAGALLWIVGETWVNQLAGEKSRGRIVAAFNMAVVGGFALGPLILVATGTEGWLPFLVSAAIMLLALPPLYVVMGDSPTYEGVPSARLPVYLVLAPVAMALCLVFAALEGALLSFLPIYGQRLGLSEIEGLSLITVLGVGGLVIQLPLGWLADRVERRLLTVGCAALALACVGLMPFVLGSPGQWAYILIFGGLHTALYTLGMVLLGERFRNADLVSASTVFGVMFSLGSVIGPAVAGLGMTLWEPHGFPVSAALMLAVFLPLPVLAYLRRARSATPSA